MANNGNESSTSLASGVAEELDFWKRFVRSDRFVNTWLPTNRITDELLADQREVVDFLLSELEKNERLSVLDVGSGVVSILRGLVPEENLVATDLLAIEYGKIFDYDAAEIRPPVAIGAERLPFVNMFDVVHMRNALDHTQDAAEAFRRLVGAAKRGGFVIVHGFANEGASENYFGMHKWNLRLDGASLVISNKEGNLFTAPPATIYSTKEISTGKTWISYILKK